MRIKWIGYGIEGFKAVADRALYWEMICSNAEQRLKVLLALAERQVPQIMVTFEHKVEGEEDQIIRLLFRERSLQG